MKLDKERYGYTLQLNPNVPEERKAIEIIERAKDKKIDFKGLVLPLILDLEGFPFDSPLSVVNELLVSIEEVKQIADKLKEAGTIQYVQTPQSNQATGDNAVNENDAFMQSIKAKAREGRRK